jgi:lipoate-protein ligase A
LNAELRGRSSIFVGDRKVSGNAQYATAGRLISHGTLLVNSDLAQLQEVIKPPQQRVQSRAVQSVRSRVANINDLLPNRLTIDEVNDHVRHAFLEPGVGVPLHLDDDEWEAVRQIAQERYRSWAWNIGRSPKCTMIRRADTKFGEVALEILVEKGYIQACRLVDNDSQLDRYLLNLCDRLQDVRFEHDDLVATLQRDEKTSFPPGLVEELIVRLLF